LEDLEALAVAPDRASLTVIHQTGRSVLL